MTTPDEPDVASGVRHQMQHDRPVVDADDGTLPDEPDVASGVRHRMQHDHSVVDADDEAVSRRRALGAAVGLAVVIVTYGASGLGDSSRWWAAAAAILVAVALADLLLDVRRLLPVPGVAPLTLVAALVGIGLCVPETDQIPIAALLPLVVVGLEVVGRRQVGIEWYAVAAASVLWAGMFGATGRQSALVGALFAWWAVALVPLVHAVRPLKSTAAGVAVAAIGAVAVAVMARTGGIADTGAAAWLSAVVAAAVSFGLALGAAHLIDGRPGEQAAGGGLTGS